MQIMGGNSPSAVVATGRFPPFLPFGQQPLSAHCSSAWRAIRGALNRSLSQTIWARSEKGHGPDQVSPVAPLENLYPF